MSHIAQVPPKQASCEEAMLLPLERVGRSNRVGTLPEQLLALRQWLAADLLVVETAIGQAARLATANGAAMAAQAAAQHLLQQQGKRLRPLCVLVAGQLGSISPSKAKLHAAAAACELVHTATLLHDDVIDLGQERRGHPTARMLYGNATSILAGDGLLVGALQRLVEQDLIQLLEQLLQIVRGMVQAEAWQLEQRGQFVVDRELYLQIIGGKTAALFAWSLQAGGQLANLSPAAIAALGQVGQHVGCAFQLIDDVLDVLTPEHHSLGKDSFADVREGKLTWPLMYAVEQDAGLMEHLQAIAQLSTDDEQGGQAADLEQHYRFVQQSIERTGALPATRQFARQQIQRAEQAMAVLPAGWAKDALQLVLNMAVERAY